MIFPKSALDPPHICHRSPRIALSFNLMSSNPPEGTGGADPNWEVLADASVVMAAEG